MKRFFSMPVHLHVVFVNVILTWALIGCTSGIQSPAIGGSATPPATLSLPATPVSDLDPCPTPGSDETAIPFESLAQGYRLSSSQSKPAMFMAVDDLSRDALAPLISEKDQSLLSDVDMNRRAVLAATWGVKPSGGYSITICSISTADMNLTVNVILKENDPNTPRVDASTFPYHLVAIDRLDLPGEGKLHYRLISSDTLLAEGELP
jgi:hypothetical protein